MKRRPFNFRLAYIDLLLNFMVGLIFILLMSQPIQKKATTEQAGIKKNAEMIIQVDWSPAQDCDVDIWVRDPFGNVVFYQQKDKGLMHIERDDLGFVNDILTITKQLLYGAPPPENDINQEIWVLRGKIPGEFTFNLHLYSCRIEATKLKVGDPIKVPVTVTFIKVNPDYLILKKETVEFDHVWQEMTVENFTLDKDGFVTNFNKNFRKLVHAKEDQ